MKFFKTKLFIFLIFFSQLSFSKVHLESYLGYSFTLMDANFLNKNSFHGLTPGLRLGYSSLGLATGVDFNVGIWKPFDWKKPLSYSSDFVTPVFLGLFLSYKLPLFFRVYSTVIPMVLNLTDKNSSFYCESNTQALKIGFSYLSLPFLSINFEWLPMYRGGEKNCRGFSHTVSISGNVIF
ncbi:MAG: hypothetical protein GDA46_05300 [Bdellovibrionales bacterium]|nr:hypothetical protein [Bdellovibrionales bacterium]